MSNAKTVIKNCWGLLFMNNIVESQLDSVVSTIIAALLSFVLTNILIVLLIVVVIIGLISILMLNTKRKHTTQMLKRASQLQHNITSNLNEILVADTFKELELGLAQGETERGLQRMQKAAFGLHQQSEQLGIKLKGNRSSLFSPQESLHQAEELELEAEDLHERVERYLHDLSNIEQSVRGTGQHMRLLQDRLSVVLEQIEKIGEERGYPLNELRQQLTQVESEFKKTDQLAAFDAVQAKPELSKLGRLIEALHLRTQELQKNITIMDQIRNRLQMQEEQLLLQIEQQQMTKEGPVTLLRRTDPIIQQLNKALQSGQEVDLRTAASDIETILRQAFELVESNG